MQALNISVDQLLGFVNERFTRHPFEGTLSLELLETLLPEYLAMSQAFPYLQAGAPVNTVLECIANNVDVPPHVELTGVVGSFLCWDEMGGHHAVLEHGSAGLPHILDTQLQFHANLLRQDASSVLGRPVQPRYGTATRRYLNTLYEGLSSADAVARCAYMVAFEMHAERMISALWHSIVDVSGTSPDRLVYFNVHVGGSDPAEKYHGEMTRQLIEKIVPQEDHVAFLAKFEEAYRFNIEWCRSLVESPESDLEADSLAKIWHGGACHCRTVRFEVLAPPSIAAVRCNCSICSMTGFLHLLVEESDIRILAGEEKLGSYRFNKQIALHTFCSICGVKPFYRPRSNPLGYSVNVLCLNRATVESVRITEFDGKNWDSSIHRL